MKSKRRSYSSTHLIDYKKRLVKLNIIEVYGPNSTQKPAPSLIYLTQVQYLVDVGYFP